jgi:hypothetical protein
MKNLPKTNATPLLRADFSSSVQWDAIRKEIAQPSPEGFKAHVEFIDDQAFDGVAVEQLLGAVSPGVFSPFIIVADRASMVPDDRTLLIVGLDGEEAGKSFRAIMSEIWAVENNLSLGNMDFEDFAGAVDANGVFRGF